MIKRDMVQRSMVFILSLALLLLITLSVTAEDYYFRFVTHGGDDPFWAVVQQGMMDAARELGVGADMDLAGGDLALQQQRFEEAIAMGVDGIALVVNDDEVWNEPVQRAIDMGIFVIGINNDHSQGSSGNPRQAYIGQDEARAGYMVGRRLFEEGVARGWDLSEAHVVMPVEVPGATYGVVRSAGIKRAMEEYGVTSYEIMDAGGLEMTTVESRINAYLLANPQTNFVIGLGGITTDRITSALRGLDYEPEEIIAGGFDPTPGTLSGLRSGHIIATVDQQQYLQGYFGVYTLYLMVKYGFAPNIDTGGFLVEVDDIGLIEEFSDLNIR